MGQSNEEILNVLKNTKRHNFYNLNEDGSNLDEILDEYRTIAKVARRLLSVKGKYVEDVMTSHASEFEFFDECRVNLKSLLDYYLEYLKYERGKEYAKIMEKEPRSVNDRTINSLIDSRPHIIQHMLLIHKVRDVYDRFCGILESYKQRGYQLNNYTKHTEYGTRKEIL